MKLIQHSVKNSVLILLVAAHAIIGPATGATLRPGLVSLVASRGAKVFYEGGFLKVQLALAAPTAGVDTFTRIMPVRPSVGVEPQPADFKRAGDAYSAAARQSIQAIGRSAHLLLPAEVVPVIGGRAGGFARTGDIITLPLSGVTSATIDLGFASDEHNLDFRKGKYTATVTVLIPAATLSNPPAVKLTPREESGTQLLAITRLLPGSTTENPITSEIVVGPTGTDAGFLLTQPVEMPSGLLSSVPNGVSRPRPIQIAAMDNATLSIPGTPQWAALAEVPVFGNTPNLLGVKLDVSLYEMLVNVRFPGGIPVDAAKVTPRKMSILGVEIDNIPPEATTFRSDNNTMCVQIPPDLKNTILRKLQGGSKGTVVVTAADRLEIFNGETSILTVDRNILTVKTAIASLAGLKPESDASAAVEAHFTQTAFDTNHAKAMQHAVGFDASLIDNDSKASTFKGYYDYLLHSQPRAEDSKASRFGVRTQVDGRVGANPQFNTLAGVAWQYYTFNTADLGRVPLFEVGLVAGSELERARPGRRDDLYGRLELKFERSWTLDDIFGSLVKSGLVPKILVHPLAVAYYDTRNDRFDALSSIELKQIKKDGSAAAFFDVTFGTPAATLEGFGTVLKFGLSGDF